MWEWVLWIGGAVWAFAILRYLLLLWIEHIDFD